MVTNDRDGLTNGFLAQAGWTDIVRAPLAGDASQRRYERIQNLKTGVYGVLMDAPPATGEDITPFVHIGSYLTNIGLSAPAILASDPENGLLLLEDLGDDLFARHIADGSVAEETLYAAAVDVLVELHQHAPPDNLAPYSTAHMAGLTELVPEWYLPATGQREHSENTAFCSEIETLLSTHAPTHPVMIHRDFHAENLLWLPQRDGLRRVGLLDFQDAMLGHRAYDLVSLLQDARRDVSPAVEETMINRYISKSGVDAAPFRAAYAAWGVQRHLRIIGVFARLCVRDGKPEYIDFMPRVWGYLIRDLSHPALHDIQAMLLSLMPAPTPVICQRIRSLCPTNPRR